MEWEWPLQTAVYERRGQDVFVKPRGHGDRDRADETCTILTLLLLRPRSLRLERSNHIL